jgi:3-deoxy-7-phosphoheptulonate synthase
MLESNIKAGKQALSDNPASLEYGKSVTDGCMGWEETESLLLATAQRLRSGVSSPL